MGEEMLRAAMNAPTARNTQSWRFLVITNRETLNHMTELQPYTGMMKEAYCAILVMGDRNVNPIDEYLYVDAAAAIENMLIEGVHQGLGTCWCAVGPSKERISKFKEYFHLEDHLLSLCQVRADTNLVIETFFSICVTVQYPHSYAQKSIPNRLCR